ncbi:MAG: hypothetical protein ABL866_15240 [Devosia sp.]
MAWMLLALVLFPFVGLPLLRLVLAPRRTAPAIPWLPVGVALALLVALWSGFGTGGTRPNPTPSYADADSTLRGLIE